MAEGRGKAQAESLRKTRRDVMAKRLAEPNQIGSQLVSSSELKKGDVVLVEAGDLIPMDGEVIEGVASVNESAVTGESAPGHPGKRRRPERGNGRDHGPFRLAGGANHLESRRDVPRPNDIIGRRRKATEDAE